MSYHRKQPEGATTSRLSPGGSFDADDELDGDDSTTAAPTKQASRKSPAASFSIGGVLGGADKPQRSLSDVGRSSAVEDLEPEGVEADRGATSASSFVPPTGPCLSTGLSKMEDLIRDNEKGPLKQCSSTRNIVLTIISCQLNIVNVCSLNN